MALQTTICEHTLKDVYDTGKQDGVRLSMNLIQSLAKLAPNSGSNTYRRALEDLTEILQPYANSDMTTACNCYAHT